MRLLLPQGNNIPKDSDMKRNFGQRLIVRFGAHLHVSRTIDFGHGWTISKYQDFCSALNIQNLPCGGVMKNYFSDN
jgi:hypothetical protein